MADETVFDFLHSEVVNHVCRLDDPNPDRKVLIKYIENYKKQTDILNI